MKVSMKLNRDSETNRIEKQEHTAPHISVFFSLGIKHKSISGLYKLKQQTCKY